MSQLARIQSRLLNITVNRSHVIGKASFSRSVKLININTCKHSIDYEHFLLIKPIACMSILNRNCFSSQPGEGKNILNPDERISVTEYKQIVDSGVKHLLIDVRPSEDAAAVKLDQAINFPLKQLLHEEGLKQFTQLSDEFIKDGGKVYVMCRKGIASQIAVRYLKDKLQSEKIEVKDIVGGLTAWSKEIDSSIKID